MRKIIPYRNSPILQYAFTALMVFLCSSHFYAQENHSHDKWEKNIEIAYNTPFSYTLDKTIQWQMHNNQEKIIEEGVGNINDFIFTTPGNYEIDIKKNEISEEHGNVPNRLNIKVFPYKMEYIVPSVQFSKNIVGGQSTQTITVKANVNFSSYDDKSAVFDKELKCSGIDCTIIGKLKNGPVTLQQGINALEFQLQGKALPNSYISFYLININDEIQPYDITHQIK